MRRAPSEPPIRVPQAPARARAPELPNPTLIPRPGQWLWTCRAGFEAHLFEELVWAKASARVLGPALLESAAVQKLPAFVRSGFRIDAVLPSTDAMPALPASGPVHVQAWAPDTDQGNRFSDTVRALEARVQDALGERNVPDLWTARARNATLLQLCLLDGRQVAVGAHRAADSVSPYPGGKHRMRRDREAPSRAAMKLEEALDVLGLEPSRGEVCVDLGAAPGGWTQRLLARGAKVIAIDPANMAEELRTHPKLQHVKASAFGFTPDESVDWLFCDMAWRPLEVAQMLARWGRKRFATLLVANIKLPMNDKNPVLFRVRHTLEEGGWKLSWMRQLYHDRDEVTVAARSQ